MAADFYSILDNFKNFIGGRTGLFHWCLFCLAVVMLFFLGRKYQEEKQTVRFLVWPTILVLLFLFNPLFYRYVGSRFFAGVYWRLFWMLPVSFTAAYVVVWLVCRWKKQAVRIVVLVAALGTIALSGQKIYSKATFTEAETTTPAREITAISDVPAPISTIRLPNGFVTSTPAPIAAAIGSSTM